MIVRKLHIRHLLLLIGAIIIVGASSCKKQQLPDLPKEPIDTSYIANSVVTKQLKHVLVQEFTGVYCYTCPSGHQAVADIIMANPGRISAMNIHSVFYGIYSNPAVMGNKYDFRTEDGDSIVSFLGGISSVPSGAIDMKIQSGETTILSTKRANWGDYVSDQINEMPPVNVEIESSLNSFNRYLRIVITLKYTEDVSENNYLTVAIVENNIVDKQYVDTVVVDDYIHQHILKKCLTLPKGSLIDASLEKGRVYIRVYEYFLPSEWNENNVEIVAYVHERDNSTNVLQAASYKIK